MAFTTRVDNPLCNRLPSYLNKMADQYDSRVLKKFRRPSEQRSKSVTTPMHSIWSIRHDGKRGCSVSPIPVLMQHDVIQLVDDNEEEQWARSHSRSPNFLASVAHPQSTPKSASFSNKRNQSQQSPDINSQYDVEYEIHSPPVLSPYTNVKADTHTGLNCF